MKSELCSIILWSTLHWIISWHELCIIYLWEYIWKTKKKTNLSKHLYVLYAFGSPLNNILHSCISEKLLFYTLNVLNVYGSFFENK